VTNWATALAAPVADEVPVARAGIATLPMPAGITCPGASEWCLLYCYAKAGWYIRRALLVQTRLNNWTALEAAHRRGGEKAVEDELATAFRKLSTAYGIVRLNDGGDFPARWFVRSMLAAIRRNPDILFYAYTKSHWLFEGEEIPNNLRLTQSLDGKWDNKADLTEPHALVFPTLGECLAVGYIDGSETDIPAISGRETRIGLPYHGQRRLTAEEEEHLREVVASTLKSQGAVVPLPAAPTPESAAARTSGPPTPGVEAQEFSFGDPLMVTDDTPDPEAQAEHEADVGARAELVGLPADAPEIQVEIIESGLQIRIPHRSTDVEGPWSHQQVAAAYRAARWPRACVWTPDGYKARWVPRTVPDELLRDEGHEPVDVWTEINEDTQRVIWETWSWQVRLDRE